MSSIVWGYSEIEWKEKELGIREARRLERQVATETRSITETIRWTMEMAGRRRYMTSYKRSTVLKTNLLDYWTPSSSKPSCRYPPSFFENTFREGERSKIGSWEGRNVRQQEKRRSESTWCTIGSHGRPPEIFLSISYSVVVAGYSQCECEEKEAARLSVF